MIDLGDRIRTPLGMTGYVLTLYFTPEGWERALVRDDTTGRAYHYPLCLLRPYEPDQLEISNADT